ncbi:farnesyl-diphosphate synthase [Anoxybacillus gonensis]|uniref:Farnesyl diphosphate synthase n=1 Tax=Anoxybacillus gonensis TaxID=198467 RepID=A0AAW7TDK0_9BACL|nr:farnesyl diphosphate synthase [Anoxybacillus gonensis]AKS38858.1 farnesyl-diphosphate synthase [Anoxybacillus gonensis]EMI09814.1 geranylgeranyl pyrophosphate synthase [Anoxybacillus gonensis]KGP60037.1 farnesyl-diphosphate synthase [Anoxybacillus gonensis]MCQ5364120.1 polyprenyl synthetase family protein [Anoxybacillus gonensis]MCX8047819.1 polyprenyl synthetase family protein [Anoxybacillus gonensis]
MESLLRQYKSQIEQQLPAYIESLQAPQTIKEAMLYSLQAGGKRIRPLLLLSTLQAFQKPVHIGLPTACALEMIHTYSLIHDDLPSMDNDDLRRGKPTNHKVFGEANAILAGDALLTYAFQVVADDEAISPDVKVRLISELAKAAGPEGMVGGQVADLEGEGKTISLQQLEYIHRHKTGKLLQYSVRAGAILGEATEQQLTLLTTFADHLGLAFQIRDDILDIEGDEQKIGKKVGSDIENDKSTYPSLLTLDGAKKKLHDHMKEARKLLDEAKIDASLLHYICDVIETRDH